MNNNKSIFGSFEELSRGIKRILYPHDASDGTLTEHLEGKGIPASLTHAGVGALVVGLLGGGIVAGAALGLVLDKFHKNIKNQDVLK